MNYQETAEKILGLVGGKENVSFATYCMTRLRLVLRDKAAADVSAIKGLPGIVDVREVGEQTQVVIGPDVEHVYKAFRELGGFEESTQIDENLDAPAEKRPLTLKGVVDRVLEVVSACVTPMLPIVTAAGMIKLIVAVLGPSMLNVLPETSDLMRLLTFVGDAGFYFFPMYVAYSAAKKFNVNIPLALFIAGVLLHPTLNEIVAAGEPFTVYGIPMRLVGYSSNFISMLLVVWCMSYVEPLVNKIVPTSLRAMLFPTLMILIMLPIALCALGPLGSWIGSGIAQFIVILHTYLGPVSIALIAATWPLLIATGMHQALIAIALTYIAANGFDDSILVGAIVCNYPMIAIGLAYLIKAKAEERSLALSSFVTLALGGISEPTLFGIILTHPRAILAMMAGGLVGGLYAGIMGVAVYFVGAGNVSVALGFAGANPASLPQGIVACVIAFVITFALMMFLGFEKKDEVKA